MVTIFVYMKKQTHGGVRSTNQPSPQRTRCYADALTTIPRCPWPPSDRFIVCLERTCSMFTTALGAELEWRHVTRVRTPATCVTLVNLSAPTLVSTNPCALTRIGAGARPAGRSADQPGRPSPNDHDRATAHPRSGVPPLPPPPLLSSRRTEVSFGSRR